jgi:hypothetical protein
MLRRLLRLHQRREKIRRLQYLYGLAIVPILLGVVVWRIIDERYPPRITGVNAKTPLLRSAVAITLLAFLLHAGLATAFACNEGRLHVYNQAFQSKIDRTLIGNIHGWLADCNHRVYSCGEECTKSQGTTTCSVEWCSEKQIARYPSDFVRVAAREVAACGFEMVDMVPRTVMRRIPNPRIEGHYWVKISVNRFNETNGTNGLEEQVRCLYDMAPWLLRVVKAPSPWQRTLSWIGLS